MTSNSNQIVKGAWLVVALLVPVALLNYMDRQMLAAMKYSVMTDITDIGSEKNWGAILALFKWVYAIFSPIGGYIADRYSRRRVVSISLLVWSAVTWATGHVTTYNELLATRAIMGISEAFYMPAALALIADFHIGPTRSRAVGWHQVGIYAGVIIGGFSGYAADSPDFGWRWMFDACGIIGIIYSIPLFWLLKNPPKVNVITENQNSSAISKIKELVYNKSFIMLVLYFTLPAIAGWVVRDWMPVILKDSFGISQGKAGISATASWVIAAIFGAIISGWLADKWMRKNIRGRIYVSAIGMSFIVLAIFGTGYSPSTGMLEVAIGCLFLFGLGWGFFDTNNMPILCQIARPNLRSTGYGLMNFISISIGGFADWGFGILRDNHVSIFGIFGTFAGFAILSIILVLLIKPSYTEKTQKL